MTDLASRHCVNGRAKLDDAAILALLDEVPGWLLVEEGTALTRTFAFADYWETMAFVNAVARIAHGADHHPDLSVHYNRCVARWSTHDAGGLTENDFIAAAKVSALLPR
jgi:4a-hydroxytetrahydrobiopterin dehydratase